MMTITSLEKKHKEEINRMKERKKKLDDGILKSSNNYSYITHKIAKVRKKIELLKEKEQMLLKLRESERKSINLYHKNRRKQKKE